MPKPPSHPPRVEIISTVAQKRSALQRLGKRPDHEKVDVARCKLREVESDLSKKLHEIVLSPRPENRDRFEWRMRLAEREKECREEAEKQAGQYRALVLLDDMHEAYGRSLREAEERLVKVYETSFDKIAPSATELGDVEVVASLREALRKTGFERVDLSCRRLRVLPEKVLGSIRRVVLLNLSANQLQVSLRSPLSLCFLLFEKSHDCALGFIPRCLVAKSYHSEIHNQSGLVFGLVNE